jgi:cytochrome c-type biogenesis protein CcmE
MFRRRVSLIALLIVLAFGVAANSLAPLLAGSSGMPFFNTPTELAAMTVEEGKTSPRIRLGGCVAAGSVKKDGLTIIFDITDGSAHSVQVRYSDLLPSLFAERQGVIAEGTLGPEHIFTATAVLAKYDEKYMPPEVAEMKFACEMPRNK